MDNLNSVAPAGGVVDATEVVATETNTQDEGQQIETTEVGQEAAQEQPSGNGEKQPESDSERQARLERERQAEGRRKMADMRKRLIEIEASEKAIKDPSYDAFDDPDKRIALMAANEAHKMNLGNERSRLERDIRDAQAQAQRDYEERANRSAMEARKIYSDFDAKITTLNAVTSGQLNPAISDALEASNDPSHLAYYLGNNPELAMRINAMPELSAAREIGRIEAGLNIPKPKTQTQAPAPIKPLKQTDTKVTKDPADMTFAEYEAARKAGEL